jgi:hypothetical protein
MGESKVSKGSIFKTEIGEYKEKINRIKEAKEIKKMKL